MRIYDTGCKHEYNFWLREVINSYTNNFYSYQLSNSYTNNLGLIIDILDYVKFTYVYVV